ncbi:MAG TPA: AraC family transcriptional regulator [Oceanipulchritudo sp.]|nr:AraC family transcriptional regulator [Oceanipulchritudo sp.]
MKEQLTAFQRYLAPRSPSNEWGIRATDLGYTKIPPGHPYPPFKHPESYTLNQQEGRVLEEYQIIYITRGKGIFWSERSGTDRIESGTVFLLFPGVRHRYRPDPSTGWDEHWIGFSGFHVDRIVPSRFSPERPVFKIGVHPEMQLLFSDSCELARHETYGFRERIGIKILDLLVELDLKIHAEASAVAHYEPQIRKACCQMVESIDKPFDSEAFARENGISHTSFRRHFKAQMGMAPVQYLLDLRMRKAIGLLMHTTLPVKTIAQECGFENPLYFSRMFKKRTGDPPSDARRG